MLDGWEDLLASWRPLNMGCKVQDSVQNEQRTLEICPPLLFVALIGKARCVEVAQPSGHLC